MDKKEFKEKYCSWCGSQKCNSTDESFREGCGYYLKEVLGKDEITSDTRKQLVNFYETKLQNIGEEMERLEKERDAILRKYLEFVAKNLNREYKKEDLIAGQIIQREDMLFIVNKDLEIIPFWE